MGISKLLIHNREATTLNSKLLILNFINELNTHFNSKAHSEQSLACRYPTMDEIGRDPGMETVHLHQVRPLQRYTKVQAAGLQPDSHDSRVLHLHAQRHGGLYVTMVLHKYKVNGIYLRFISYLCNGFEAVAYHTSSFCLCERASAVLLVENEADALLSCKQNLENSKLEQDGVRRFTYIRGLAVSWSFLRAVPEPYLETWDTQAHVSYCYQTVLHRNNRIS